MRWLASHQVRYLDTNMTSEQRIPAMFRNKWKGRDSLLGVTRVIVTNYWRGRPAHGGGSPMAGFWTSHGMDDLWADGRSFFPSRQLRFLLALAEQ
jgi:hypothetical protein